MYADVFAQDKSTCFPQARHITTASFGIGCVSHFLHLGQCQYADIPIALCTFLGSILRIKFVVASIIAVTIYSSLWPHACKNTPTVL